VRRLFEVHSAYRASARGDDAVWVRLGPGPRAPRDRRDGAIPWLDTSAGGAARNHGGGLGKDYGGARGRV